MGLIPKGFDSHGNKRALKRKLIPMGLIPKGFDSQGIWLPWDLIPMGIQFYHKPISIFSI